MNLYKGDFYDADYFERGKQSGKGWLENYRWLPIRSTREALGFIDYSGIDESSSVLDIGCAKGFLVKALNYLGINAEGCDISEYALGFSNQKRTWNCSTLSSWLQRKGEYTHALSKDVLEHLCEDEVIDFLQRVKLVAEYFMCVIPMGDNGRYRIEEYHTEISHQIAEDEDWWKFKFKEAGWTVMKDTKHVPGIKDNWENHASGLGNRVFLLVRSCE